MVLLAMKDKPGKTHQTISIYPFKVESVCVCVSIFNDI